MNKTRKPRPDLTKEELERLEKYGSIEFKSAGAVRAEVIPAWSRITGEPPGEVKASRRP